MGSIELPLGILVGRSGEIIGCYRRVEALASKAPTPPETLIRVTLCLLAGFNLFLPLYPTLPIVNWIS